jgi:hypothetical protein
LILKKKYIRLIKLIETRNNELKLNIIIESKKSETEKKNKINELDKQIKLTEIENSLSFEKNDVYIYNEQKVNNNKILNEFKSSSPVKENKKIINEEKKKEHTNYRKSVGAKFKNDLKGIYI